mgnify:CR=1 FL=1
MNHPLLEEARALQSRTVALRREIHRHPELGLDLPRTRETVLDSLAGLDLDLVLSKETSGIIATLRGERPGPSILLRGDMDALPMTEDTGLDFASEETGRMHSCGHDAHTAMLASAAALLCQRRSDLAGSVRFMFQPGEEGWGGAKIMLEEGLLALGGKPDAARVDDHQLGAPRPGFGDAGGMGQPGHGRIVAPQQDTAGMGEIGHGHGGAEGMNMDRRAVIVTDLDRGHHVGAAEGMAQTLDPGIAILHGGAGGGRNAKGHGFGSRLPSQALQRRGGSHQHVGGVATGEVGRSCTRLLDGAGKCRSTLYRKVVPQVGIAEEPLRPVFLRLAGQLGVVKTEVPQQACDLVGDVGDRSPVRGLEQSCGRMRRGVGELLQDP